MGGSPESVRLDTHSRYCQNRVIGPQAGVQRIGEFVSESKGLNRVMLAKCFHSPGTQSCMMVLGITEKEETESFCFCLFKSSVLIHTKPTF